MHHANTVGYGVVCISNGDWLAIHEDLPAVGPIKTVQNRH